MVDNITVFLNSNAEIRNFMCIISIILFIISAISWWKIFSKAGKSGWAGLIPIYNKIVLLEIVRKPCWWTILYYIPLVNLIVHMIVMCHLGDCFTKTTGFKIGLVLLPTIFEIILGFDDSQYISPINQNIFLIV